MSHCPMCGSPLPPPVDEPRTDAIIEAVCRQFYLTRSDLLSKRRHKNIAIARHALMYLLRRLTSMSYPEIGRAVGNRDHTTVMASCRKLEFTTDPNLLNAISCVLRALGATDPLRKAG